MVALQTINSIFNYYDAFGQKGSQACMQLNCTRYETGTWKRRQRRWRCVAQAVGEKVSHQAQFLKKRTNVNWIPMSKALRWENCYLICGLTQIHQLIITHLDLIFDCLVLSQPQLRELALCKQNAVSMYCIEKKTHCAVQIILSNLLQRRMHVSPVLDSWGSVSSSTFYITESDKTISLCCPKVQFHLYSDQTDIQTTICDHVSATQIYLVLSQICDKTRSRCVALFFWPHSQHNSC